MMNQVDPRTIYMLERKRLEIESSLQIDSLHKPNKEYCQAWLSERRNESKIKEIIKDVIDPKPTKTGDHQTDTSTQKTFLKDLITGHETACLTREFQKTQKELHSSRSLRTLKPKSARSQKISPEHAARTVDLSPNPAAVFRVGLRVKSTRRDRSAGAFRKPVEFISDYNS